MQGRFHWTTISIRSEFFSIRSQLQLTTLFNLIVFIQVDTILVFLLYRRTICKYRSKSEAFNRIVSNASSQRRRMTIYFYINYMKNNEIIPWMLVSVLMMQLKFGKSIPLCFHEFLLQFFLLSLLPFSRQNWNDESFEQFRFSNQLQK